MGTKATASIVLFLSGEYLEHVRDVYAVYDMWIAVKNIFQERTLLNRLNARRKFFSPKFAHEGRAIPNIDCVEKTVYPFESHGRINQRPEL